MDIPDSCANLMVVQSILIVDDEPDIVELIAYNLKAEGYDILVAANGADALDLARSAQPSLILLDMMLPEVDGMTVCEVLHRNPKTADIPVIIVTAWKSEMSRIASLAAGACGYITKPFSPRDLVGRVKNTLQSLPPSKSNKS